MEVLASRSQVFSSLASIAFTSGLWGLFVGIWRSSGSITSTLEDVVFCMYVGRCCPSAG